MMMLPVLHIKTEKVPCLVMVNGAIVGESTQMPVVPVSPNGKAYITCLPMYNEGAIAALPLSVCLEFEAGTMTAPLSNGRAHLSPQGGVYLQLQPVLLPVETQPTSPYAVSRADFRYNGSQYTATAYYEGGMHVAIDNRNSDSLDALHTPADLGTCQLSVGSCFSEADVFLSGEGPKGSRFIVYSPTAGGYKPIIDEYAMGAISGDKVQCIRRLNDTCGHEARYTITAEQGKPVRSAEEYGYFSTAMRKPQTVRDVCTAFCEAVKLGLLGEARSLLTTELGEDLDMEDISDFMGDFTHTYSPGGDSRENELWLAYPLLENCYSIKLFRFDMHGLLIGNIVD